MITTNDGVMTFTIFSSDICDVNDVAASRYVGKFSDICLMNGRLAFGIHQPSQSLDSTVLVKFTLSNQ